MRLLYTYFKDRKIVFYAEGRHYVRKTYMGGPQGLVIGPLLWLLNYDGLLTTPLPSGCNITGFAEDVGLTVEASILEELKDRVEECTGRINRWLATHGLDIAVQKTEWTFLNKKRVPGDFEFALGDVTIRSSEVERYLCVLFEPRTDFRYHIRKTVDKAMKTVGALSRLLANLHGPRMFVRKSYYAIIESIILYAAPIWVSGVGPQGTRSH